MFDKFKQAKQVNELRKSLSKEKETIEKDGVSVTVNWQMKVDDIKIDTDGDVEELVKKCVNEALQNMQKKVASKMQEMGGF